MADRVAAARSCLRDTVRPEAVVRQHALGKLTARERIAELVDPGSFVEIGALARPDRRLPDSRSDDAHADGVVVGSATVRGRTIGLISFDFTVIGGSNGIVGGEKIDRQARWCLTHGHPFVMLLDGGGHRIQEGLDSRHFAHGHRFFQIQAQMSGWVPVVSVIMGPGFAGPSNFSAMADLVVMVEGTSTMGIAGPALVRAATGEQLTKEEIGSPEAQAHRNGIADIVAPDDRAALTVVKQFLDFFPANSQLPPPVHRSCDPPDRREESLATIMPLNPRRAYDVRAVVDAIVDDGSQLVLRPNHARNAYTALARMDGRPVGIIANQPMHMGGALDAAACDKIAHLISLCDAFGLPLIYFIDVPGFLAGESAERTGLARRSGKLLFELGRATVPRFSVVLRKGYGLAYIAMAGGRSFDADLAVAWPTAEICAMSVEGAVDVAFAKKIARSDDPARARAEMLAFYRSQLGAINAGEGFGIDDVIDPCDTRAVLNAAIARSGLRHRRDEPPRHHPVTPI
jgi:acetyl-CoA carboxylase carboxyltransferase component